MREKVLFLAQAKQTKESKSKLMAGIVIFIIVSVLLLTLISKSIVFTNKPLKNDVNETTTYSTQSNVDIGLTQPRMLQGMRASGRAEAEIEEMIDVALLDTMRNNPLFSAEIEKIKKRLDIFNRSQSSDEEKAALRESIAIMYESVNSYSMETIDRIRLTILEGNSVTFSTLFNSARQFLPVTNPSEYESFISLENSTYFEDFRSMATGKSNNDTKLELGAAKRIIAVYPLPSLDQRITELEVLLLKKKTDELESLINISIVNRLFTQANEAVQELRSLEPANGNLKNYVAVIAEGLKQERIEDLSSEVVHLKKSENFELSLRLVRELLVIDSTNQFANETNEWLSQVITLNRNIDGLLSDSSRLSDPTVAIYAQNLLTQVKNFEEVKQVTERVRQLTLLLEEKQTPIEILFNSNNIARIEIRGVGYIEPTRSKIVMLRPGRYILNAVCRGHRNNLIDVVFSDLNRSIEVPCGDKL